MKTTNFQSKVHLNIKSLDRKRSHKKRGNFHENLVEETVKNSKIRKNLSMKSQEKLSEQALEQFG